MNSSIFYNKGNMREKNEDNYLVDINETRAVIVVADGMGGHRAGEVASETVIEHIKSKNFSEESNIFNKINKTINEASKKLIKMGESNIRYYQMGTTLSLGLIINNYLYIGHVGDSRIYLFRDNILDLLTKDHSLVNKLLEKNDIKEEEAFNHPQKHILTQALGLDLNLKIFNKEVNLRPDDILLFCTDGLTDMIRNKDIEKIIQKYKDENVDKLCQKLGEIALNNGGHDNITIILVKL